VALATGEYVCLLDEGVKPTNPEWLTALVEILEDEQVAVAGARLQFSDGRTAHAGYLLGVGGAAAHAFREYPRHRAGYLGLAALIRDVSAVSFAGAAVRRSVWESCAGLDAANLPDHLYDVDFCLRARAAGHHVVYTPHAILTQRRPGNASPEAAVGAEDYLFRRWGHQLVDDPFYNPSFSRTGQPYSLAL
jgi:GT2 family glycosyltransferase